MIANLSDALIVIREAEAEAKRYLARAEKAEAKMIECEADNARDTEAAYRIVKQLHDAEHRLATALALVERMRPVVEAAERGPEREWSERAVAAEALVERMRPAVEAAEKLYTTTESDTATGLECMLTGVALREAVIAYRKESDRG